MNANAKIKTRRLLLLLLFSFFFTAHPYAQENDADGLAGLDGQEGAEAVEGEDGDLAGEGPPEPSPEERMLELEIRTATLPELAAWSRALGLPEAGAREELAARLRAHFGLDFTTEVAEAGMRIITIESARVTEYFTIEIVDEEFARLSGGVRISLIDGDATHRISAQDVLFNRTRNVLTASGGVEYIVEEDGSVETFRGQSITVDLDNWAGVFLGGAMYRAFGGEGGTFSFEGRVIAVGNEDVTIIEGATIRNAENPEALWSITASRLWLLPGSDFAIFNAFLRVGAIPVLYIPFFYFPADEIIFRPVLGFRSREGTFVQTTTYIIGRPGADGASESSLTRMMGGDPDAEMVREGIFLRNTGRRVLDPAAASLSFLLDYYANLGFHFGFDFSSPALGPFNNFDMSLGLGVTRTIFQEGNNFTPFAPDAYGLIEGESDWNRSNLFGWDVPFRYRFISTGSLTRPLATFTWNLPFFSDPFVDIDFTDRSTSMDWMGMMQQGGVITEQDRLSMQIHSYQWQLSGNLQGSFPSLAPFVTTLALTSFSSTVAFRTMTMPPAHPDFNPHSPSRLFFAPDRYTIYSATGVISGTLFSRGAFPPRPAPPPAEDPLAGIGAPRSPWQAEEEEGAGEGGESSFPALAPPPLPQSFAVPGPGGVGFSLGYQLSPQSASEVQFRTREWDAQDEVDWGVESMVTIIGGSGSLNFNINHSQNLFTNTVSLIASGMWRQINFLNEEADAFTDALGNPDPAAINAARLAQYRQSHYSTFFSYVGAVNPFLRSDIWGATNFQYSLRGTLARSVFDAEASAGGNPRWNHIFPSWTREEIQVHQVAANFQANIRDHVQNVSFVAELPPLESAISANATFRKWISETNARVRVVNPTQPDNRVIQPVYITETLRFGDVGSIVHYMVLEPELGNEFTAITTTLNLRHWHFAFAAARMAGSELVTTGPNTGWFYSGEPALRPRDFTISYARNFANTEIIRDRVNFSLNVNSQAIYDIQRYTNSRFNFSAGFNLGINNFVDLSVSAISDNVVIMRYFRNLPGFEFLRELYPDGRQNNVFLDLIDSFNFFNEERRRQSGFKMRGFNISATYFLGDWNAILGVTVSPFLPQGAALYTVAADISFVVQWLPIREIRSSMAYERRTDRWTVGN